MPFSPNIKTTSLEWHQWPALDLCVKNMVFDEKMGSANSDASDLKKSVVDAQSLQGARAVSRTLLQCLRQVEKIDDGSSTQELQASILANSSYSSVMRGVAPHSSRCTSKILDAKTNFALFNTHTL